MPNPSQILRDARKSKTPSGASDLLASDLGYEEEVQSSRLAPSVIPFALAPSPAPLQQPIPDPPGTTTPSTDQALIHALVEKDLLDNPTLGLRVRTKGPFAKERGQLALDPETFNRWRNLTVLRELNPSTLFTQLLAWAKVNTDRTSLVWANQQLHSRRQVAQRHLRSAKEGGVDLQVGHSMEYVMYPIAVFNTVKKLYGDSGLKKKAFLEACLYLYLEVYAPRT